MLLNRNRDDLVNKNRKVEGLAHANKSKDVPNGLLRQCRKCKAVVLAKTVREAGYICPKCGGYFRVHAKRRIEMLEDKGSFVPWFEGMEVTNPIEFSGYVEKVSELRSKTGLDEAVICGEISIGGYKAAIGVMDGRFLMASMGRIVGEKITSMVERATKENLPVIIFSCSGGARMQEGIVSLMQMAKTSAALKKHHDSGNLYVSVLTDPTTGGVTASFAMLGDIILAEPKALIGFAGPRVIEQTIGERLPKGFQRSEYLMEHGFVDKIVERGDLKQTLADILKIHYKQKIDPDREQSLSSLSLRKKLKGDNEAKTADKIAVDFKMTSEANTDNEIKENSENITDTDIKENIENITDNEIKENPDNLTDNVYRKMRDSSLTAWDRVNISRKNDRPVAEDYIERLFDDFIEFHGDRYYKDDSAVIGGIALFHGTPITVVAQAKGNTTKENIRRNFGMPNPDGYRKALRLIKQAEKFGRPVICLVDTPGAFCGIEAEQRGQGEAIARNLFEMSAIKTPIVSLVIGEGGSGGALAMAVADKVWMLENSVYSILSPEGFASILLRDSKLAADAAGIMKMTSSDLLDLKVIDKIFGEPEGYTVENMDSVVRQIDSALVEFIDESSNYSGLEITENRYERFRNF